MNAITFSSQNCDYSESENSQAPAESICQDLGALLPAVVRVLVQCSSLEGGSLVTTPQQVAAAGVRCSYCRGSDVITRANRPSGPGTQSTDSEKRDRHIRDGCFNLGDKFGALRTEACSEAGSLCYNMQVQNTGQWPSMQLT